MKLNLLIVGFSGFAGSIARYSVYLWVGNKNFVAFPWATLFVNILGCLLIGVLGTLVEQSVPYSKQILLIGTIGFLGAFTTFSAFGFETLTLLRTQQFALALFNILGNVVLGISAVALGRFLVFSTLIK